MTFIYKVRPEADGVCTLDITVGEEQLLLGFGNADMGLVTMASLYNAEVWMVLTLCSLV